MITVVFETGTIAVDGMSRAISAMPASPKAGVAVIRWFGDCGCYESDSEVHGKANVEYFASEAIIAPYLAAYQAAA